jgi:hypothetical protein
VIKRGKCAWVYPGEPDRRCKAWASGNIGLCVGHERTKKSNKRRDEAEKNGTAFEPLKRVKRENYNDLPFPKTNKPVKTKLSVTIEDLMRTVAQAISDVQAGRMSPNSAKTVAQLCKIQADLLLKKPKKSDDNESVDGDLQEQLRILNGEEK